MKKQIKRMRTILIVFLFLISISFISALDSCVENPLATPYTGSTINGIFENTPFSISSRCGNALDITYNYTVFYYCHDQVVFSQPYICGCDGTKCIADFRQAFYWIRHFGENHNFYQVVDDNFIESVITNWIEN